MKRLFRTKKRVVTGVVAGFVLAGTAAFAVSFNWVATITGSGNAQAQTLSFVVTATVSPSPTSTFYPGGPGAALTFTVQNTNPYPITVTGAVEHSGGAVSTSGGKGTCTAPGGATFNATYVGMTGTGTGTGGLTVAGSGTITVTIGTTASTSTSAIALAADTADGCQGATYSVPLDVTAGQSGS